MGFEAESGEEGLGGGGFGGGLGWGGGRGVCGGEFGGGVGDAGHGCFLVLFFLFFFVSLSLWGIFLGREGFRSG